MKVILVFNGSDLIGCTGVNADVAQQKLQELKNADVQAQFGFQLMLADDYVDLLNYIKSEQEEVQE